MRSRASVVTCRHSADESIEASGVSGLDDCAWHHCAWNDSAWDNSNLWVGLVGGGGGGVGAERAGSVVTVGRVVAAVAH